jgi:lauroyl/myristoyl acyltransferase
MQLSEKAAHWLQTVDYGYVLPTMARLPLPLGETLSRVRGAIQASLDYDWRSLALRYPYVRERTRQAMAMIRPSAGEKYCKTAAVRRFMHNSREEWQASLFGLPVMEEISRRSTIEGISDLHCHQNKGRGMVMVSCHFDSFCMGMVLMGMKGIRVNVINTSAIEDPRINLTVRRHFQCKYRWMEARMRGKMVYHEVDMPFFYRALEQGQTVALMGDIPGSKSDVFIPFLNARFKMPVGAWHMAMKTNSLLGAFMCVHEGVGKYRVICLPPSEIDPESPLRTMKPVYAFMEAQIRRMPERWVAADLLPAYTGMA